MKRIAALASGSGSNVQALLEAARAGALAAEIAVVVADRPSGALERAEAAGVQALCLPLRDRRDIAARGAYERRLADALEPFAPDLIVLAGWMLVLSPVFLDRFPGRIINLHPALLPDGDEDAVETSHGPQPAFRGARAVRDVLRAGMPVTGATVHWVTPRCDVGPAIAREEVLVRSEDDEAALHARIKAIEHRLLPRAVALALEQIDERVSAR
ncbi:MAG: phosphoribosylglycinamide formyltransferase [Thermomicrobiales bacterium]|nr:phosphoribosylglycinamide formyltransferase [Thermomicrobiales bacterium]